MDKEDIKYLIVHTIAYDGEYSKLEDIIRWHKERGFRTIGYHYYIKKNGDIKKGREDNEVGAHCRDQGMNHKSLGIAFQGHHNKEDWTEEQKDSFIELCRLLRTRYNIPVSNVLGHREVQGVNKDCPGTKINMDTVRNMINKVENKINPIQLEKKFSGKLFVNNNLQGL